MINPAAVVFAVKPITSECNAGDCCLDFCWGIQNLAQSTRRLKIFTILGFLLLLFIIQLSMPWVFQSQWQVSATLLPVLLHSPHLFLPPFSSFYLSIFRPVSVPFPHYRVFSIAFTKVTYQLLPTLQWMTSSYCHNCKQPAVTFTTVRNQILRL